MSPNGNVLGRPAIPNASVLSGHDICVFSSSVNEMLDRIALVFGHLKEFNLKIKPKKSFFFQSSVLFLGHLLSKDGILPNP